MEGERLAAKTRRFIDILRPGFGKILEVEASGEGRLARMLSALYIGDYVSAYLGILYGKDPSTVESIDQPQARLGRPPFNPPCGYNR